MALVKARTVVEGRPINYDDPIAAKIQQRRYQILVHSLLYYELDMTLVEDSKWAQWAKELVRLQADNPDISRRVIFADSFQDFDGSTGFNLPYTDEQIVNIARRLLMRESGAECGDALCKLASAVKCTPAQYKRYKTQSQTVSNTNNKKKEATSSEQKPRKGLFSVPRT